MRLWLCLPIFALLPSCAGYGHHHQTHYAGHGGAGAAVAIIELVGAVVQLAAASEREPAVVENVYVEEPPPPPAFEPPPPLVHAPVPTHVAMTPSAAAPSPRDEPKRIDPAAARAALAARDVASCAARGVPKGYGHATVVFAPSGAPASVTVDAPAGISSDGVACLGEELGRARMPAFSGGAVSVGTTWFVPAD